MEVEVGGVEAWAGMPLGWPNPLAAEVGGVGAWVVMVAGVGGLCGPMIVPLTPLPVQLVEPPPPPPVCTGWGGIGVPPLVC